MTLLCSRSLTQQPACGGDIAFPTFGLRKKARRLRWVTLSEQKWVILAERRGTEDCNHGSTWCYRSTNDSVFAGFVVNWSVGFDVAEQIANTGSTLVKERRQLPYSISLSGPAPSPRLKKNRPKFSSNGRTRLATSGESANT